ncbi:MAG: hypothetical protein F2543_02555, partial [Actinobacteria bacterium]|nr:hypothetical protein [Actinomycetota bacterium]
MAKRKRTSASKSSGAGKSAASFLGRVLSALWRNLAKALGSSVRFLA